MKGSTKKGRPVMGTGKEKTETNSQRLHHRISTIKRARMVLLPATAADLQLKRRAR